MLPRRVAVAKRTTQECLHCGNLPPLNVQVFSVYSAERLYYILRPIALSELSYIGPSDAAQE